MMVSNKGKTKHQEDRYTVPDNTPRELRDSRKRPKGETLSPGSQRLGLTTNEGVEITLAPLLRLKESLLFKTRFSFTSEEGELESCPDDRNRVWKLWSRIIDGLHGSGNEEFQLLLDAVAKAFREARHFVLPRKADTWSMESFNDSVRQSKGKVASQTEWMDMIRSMFDTFILPFPVCAVHIPGEAIVIMKKLSVAPNEWSVGGSKLVEQKQVGASGSWAVYVLHPNRERNHKAESWVDEDASTLHEVLSSHSSLCSGIVEVPEMDDAFEGEEPIPFQVGALGRWDLMDKGHVIECWSHTNENNPEETDPTNVIGESAQLAFDLLYKIQSHKRFIVEVSPVAQKKKAKAKQKSSILPISQRPVYLSLEPQEIREQFNIATPEVPGKMRAPHERRAHLRELRSARFTWKQGQVIPVKASWVGTTSGPASEGRQYRVLVENASPHVSG